ncbi:hypothetical protein LSM04_004397 [Trypanosoma melophagium]|uniref:uncharacterized protein n=1 Tax=Trypanosoma melophagium TaxID=715481 RepID=UPI00351A19CD|nr:hypothetical protein LSM04_004397 [Trypanosoma melophagium]
MPIQNPHGSWRDGQVELYPQPGEGALQRPNGELIKRIKAGPAPLACGPKEDPIPLSIVSKKEKDWPSEIRPAGHGLAGRFHLTKPTQTSIAGIAPMAKTTSSGTAILNRRRIKRALKENENSEEPQHAAFNRNIPFRCAFAPRLGNTASGVSPLAGLLKVDHAPKAS